MASDGQERTEEATPRKRQEARRKGQIAKSIDVNGALSLFALALVLPLTVSGWANLVNAMKVSFSSVPTELSGAFIGSFLSTLTMPAMMIIAPIVGTALVVGVIANVAQVGFVLSGEALSPKLSKINPLEGTKRLFSSRTVFEALKAIAKSLIFGFLAYRVIRANWERLAGLSWIDPLASAAVVGEVVRSILIQVGVAWLILAAIDYFFQRKQMDKQLRMTKDEVRREFREQEVSPEMRMAINRKRAKLAKGRLSEQVPKADVVVTNPTHFAVAIQYDREKMHAPMVVAKGQDYLALRIREIAKASNVAVISNPPLARQLYKQCEVGDFVPRDLFGPVAELLATVYRTVKKTRR